MEDSPDKVYSKHRGLIRMLINSVVVNNPAVVDKQDLQQVGAMALIAALRSYDPSLGSLPSYIRSCIRNALIEQANSFSGAFTTDDKTRRQANLIRRLSHEGLGEEEIMARLGIKNRATFLSLRELADGRCTDIDNVDVPDVVSIEESDIFRMLGEIGLTEQENEFVNLTINNFSMDEMSTKMGVSRSTLYAIKASIKEKILAWGQD